MATQYSNEAIIKQCRYWVEHFIVPHSICPFAKKVVDEDELGYLVIDGIELEEQVMSLLGQVQSMMTNDSPETMLLIFPSLQESFDDFLTMLDVCNGLLKESGEIEVIQLASFHPEYLFEGEPEDGTSHYTNRSPWPMIHLIRQNSIKSALASFANPEQIPQRNIKLMQAMGKTELAENLARIQQIS